MYEWKYRFNFSLTVDKQLMLLKSRCPFVGFMPKNPDKYGIKEKSCFKSRPANYLRDGNYILQLKHDVRVEKVSLENVEANISSVKWDFPRKHRKCHGKRCNKVYVYHLQETNMWHMFCWHFKNNLRKRHRVLKPHAWRTYIWKTGKKFCNFIFKFQ